MRDGHSSIKGSGKNEYVLEEELSDLLVHIMVGIVRGKNGESK